MIRIVDREGNVGLYLGIDAYRFATSIAGLTYVPGNSRQIVAELVATAVARTNRCV
jgi:hypothetical protein